MTRKIVVTVPVVNNFDGVRDLMKSITDPVFNVIVIPNWTKNIGVSKGWNRGIASAIVAGATHIFVANDDIVLSPGALSVLADRLDRGDECVLATGRNTWQANLSQAECLDRKGDNEGENPDYSCFMITPRYLETVGWFDENFTPAYFEDNDSHYRINLSGHKAFNVGMATIWHPGSVSRKIGSIAEVTHDNFRKNREYYVRKWGGIPGQEKFAFPFNDPTKTVLDW